MKDHLKSDKDDPIQANLREKNFISEIEIKYRHLRQVEQNSMGTLGMKS